MFGRRREPQVEMVDVSDIRAYQLAADQKTEAERFIERALDDLLLQGIHPWCASDLVQMQIAHAAIALMCDRTAELLCEEGAITKVHFTKVPLDIWAFAMVLSQNAAVQLDYSRQLSRTPGANSLYFGDETRNCMQPAAQVPHWPAFAPDGQYPDWQDTSIPGVSLAFLKGIVRAAREIEGNTEKSLQRYEALGVPPEFDYLPEFLRQSYLEAARVHLETAEGLLINPKLNGTPLETAYIAAYEAFMGMMQAAIALAIPQYLGPDFAPSRH